MKTNLKFKSVALFFSILFSVVFCFAQSTSPFKVRYKGYIKGDITLIANNIVNRVDAFHSSNDSYDERSNYAKLNDEFTMDFIDVDNDITTFSSSSANLTLDNSSNKKIIYAGLYWSATYPYTSGKQIAVNKYKSTDEARKNFSQVKLKLPYTTNYQTITGEVIFDGLESDVNETAPYAVYADITSLVQSLPNPCGVYTVADVKATVGKISGGIAAGWSIFFIYEDPEMSGKYINSYDGFASVTKKPIDINFSGFQTFPEGNVQAKIACMALEGDYSMEGDQLFIKSDLATKFTPLSNKLRKENNFFNSAISLEENYFINRTPKNTNTLGYDAFIMKISNPDNAIIQNNTQGITMRLETFGERYFVFFNAFAVEVTAPADTHESELLVASNDLKQEPILEKNNLTQVETITQPQAEKPKTIVQIKNSESNIIAAASIVIEKPKVLENKHNTVLKTDNNIAQPLKVNRPIPVESPSVSVPNVASGYYTIVNVFAVHKNAIRFVEKLKKQGLQAAYFINPKNKFRYVYLTKHTTFEAATIAYHSNFGQKYKDAAWIMTINKEENAVSLSIQPLKTNRKQYFIKEEKVV
jgi:hypothetical protein